MGKKLADLRKKAEAANEELNKALQEEAAAELDASIVKDAKEIAHVCMLTVEAFMSEGFSREDAVCLTKLLVEKSL